MKSLVLLIALSIFGVSLFALPKSIQADRYLIGAKKHIENKDYTKAIDNFEKIVELDVVVPDAFYFHYAKTLLQVGKHKKSINLTEMYLDKVGKNGEFYMQALELYNQAEEGIDESNFVTQISGLMWQDAEYTKKERKAFIKLSYGKVQNWQGANDYCENSNFAGYSDWYLPSKSQLKSLYNNKSLLKNNVSSSFWSSTEYESDSSNAWFVGFFDGDSLDYDKSNVLFVRCVRAGQ